MISHTPYPLEKCKSNSFALVVVHIVTDTQYLQAKML